MRKAFLLGLVIIFSLYFSVGPVLACVGSRPLGMGGAFIGVTDSIETVYWNPAGLDQIKKEAFHFTITLNPEDQMGYRSFFAINRNFTLTSMGFSYITRLRSWNVFEEWYVLSIATNPIHGFSIGINGRYETHSNGSTDQQVDLSSLWRITDAFTIGFLYQSMNNFRPGFSYKLGEHIVLSMDMYNAFRNQDILAGGHRIMWGVELEKDNFAVRFGEYAEDFTCGISFNNLDLAVMQRNETIILLGYSIR